MSDSNRFTSTVDLTSRAQREKRQENAVRELAQPESSLPEVTFDELPTTLQAAARAAGWASLMPVQSTAIPYLLNKRDLIVQSKTGSGKTGAFLLPLFELIELDRKEPQALILTPTRELARQIHEELERMQSASDVPMIRTALIYGGVRYAEQFKSLEQGAQVVVGTPGRILDHLERKSLSLRGLSVLVLDEADEMLSMGFYPAMQQLQRYLPRERTSYMFSATIPHRVRTLADTFLNDPGFLSLSMNHVSVDALTHRYYVVEPMEKDRALVRLIEMENPDSAIIFANTKRDVEYLTRFLRNYGYDADEISGDLTQKAREQVMGRIRSASLRFLVATDVAARGIDISDLSHVFMHDVPQDPEYYVHRSGRTARAGKTGSAIVLCTLPEERTLTSIARRYGIELERRPVPEDEDVERRVAERMTVLLEARLRSLSNLERERLRRFVPLARELATEEPEILAALTRDLVATHRLDAGRVYVAGLSAGGAMAAVLASTHPELYAAIGVHSGLRTGLANDMPSAFAAMRKGAGSTGRSPTGGGRTVPAIVFHGDSDTTVHPDNGHGVVEQSLGGGTGPAAGSTSVERETVPGGRTSTRTVHRTPEGKAVAEHWVIHGGGHAWSGGDMAGSYADPQGPDASAHMLRFFSGLRS